MSVSKRYREVYVPDGAAGIRWEASRWENGVKTMRCVERLWRRVLVGGGFGGHRKLVPASAVMVEYLSPFPFRWVRIWTKGQRGE